MIVSGWRLFSGDHFALQSEMQVVALPCSPIFLYAERTLYYLLPRGWIWRGWCRYDVEDFNRWIFWKARSKIEFPYFLLFYFPNLCFDLPLVVAIDTVVLKLNSDKQNPQHLSKGLCCEERHQRELFPCDDASRLAILLDWTHRYLMYNLFRS